MRIMKKLLLISLVLFASCTNHQLDGQYYAEEYVGWTLVKTKIIVEGNNITIDNSVTGTYRYKCCQYQDRIEYFLPNKVIAIIHIAENGNLILNDEVSLKKIDLEKTKNDSIQSLKKVESDVSTYTYEKNAKTIKSYKSKNSDVEAQFALIKDIRKENGHVYIILDYLQVIDEMGNTKNDNPKLRTFMLSDDCVIMSLTTDEEITIDNIEKYKDKLISTNKKENQALCTIKNGLLTYLSI
jgi:hypothetical protein